MIGPEGCLSFPGIAAEVERFKQLKVRYQDLDGKQQEMIAKDFLARIIQHETDHLNGVLFIEHLGFQERKEAMDDYEKPERHDEEV